MSDPIRDAYARATGAFRSGFSMATPTVDGPLMCPVCGSTLVAFAGRWWCSRCSHTEPKGTG